MNLRAHAAPVACILLALSVTTFATGCAQKTAPAEAAKASSSSTPTAQQTILPGEADTSAGNACGQLSVLLSIKTQSQVGAKAGTISPDVERAELGIVSRGVSNIGAQNAALASGLSALTAAMRVPDAKDNLPFDPSSAAVQSAESSVTSSCAAAGSKVVIDGAGLGG